MSVVLQRMAQDKRRQVRRLTGDTLLLNEQYWFAIFYQVLEALMALPVHAADSVMPTDWTKLAGSLPDNDYQPKDVQQLFYPARNAGDNEDDDDSARLTEPTPEAPRKPGFLSLLGKKEYHEMYRHILQHHPRLCFPDVQSLLQIKKDEGEIMTRVMDHIVLWINPQPVDIVDRRESNKPLRREDFIPALQGLLGTNQSGSRGLERGSNGDDSADGDVAVSLEQCSILLEKRVLDYVRSHMARFKDPSTKYCLDLMPEEDETSYGERFAADDLWRGLFRIVKDIVGLRFRPMWQAAVSGGGDDIGNDDVHQYHNNVTRRKPASAITRAICSQLRNIPEVTENPALSSVYASTELSALIDQTVLVWAAGRCRKALGENESDDGTPWSNKTVRTIEEARRKYEQLLSEETATSLRQQQQQSQGVLS